MAYVVITVFCTIVLFIAWTSVKEAEVIKEEEERRQNQFAIEQYNRNKPAKLHVKTIEELKEKLEE